MIFYTFEYSVFFAFILCKFYIVNFFWYFSVKPCIVQPVKAGINPFSLCFQFVYRCGVIFNLVSVRFLKRLPYPFHETFILDLKYFKNIVVLLFQLVFL